MTAGHLRVLRVPDLQPGALDVGTVFRLGHNTFKVSASQTGHRCEPNCPKLNAAVILGKLVVCGTPLGRDADADTEYDEQDAAGEGAHVRRVPF
jgi:hypothetical protein